MLDGAKRASVQLLIVIALFHNSFFKNKTTLELVILYISKQWYKKDNSSYHKIVKQRASPLQTYCLQIKAEDLS